MAITAEPIEEQNSEQSVEKTNPQFFPVQEAKRPQDQEAATINEYFNISKASGLVLWPGAEHPIKLPPIDFCFGSGEDLSLPYIYENENEQKGLSPGDLTREINEFISRIRSWNEEDMEGGGEFLKDQIINLIESAHKIAFVVCHGGTYNDEEGQTWGLYALDMAYGADRVMRALQQEGYDLVIFNACNTDGIPFQVEKEDKPRPAIIRFDTDNSREIIRDLPKDKSPIKIITAIK